MTEEEKKAIDLLKFYEGFFKNIGHEEEVKSIESVINCIEKLKKEIEEKTIIIMAGAEKVKQLEKEFIIKQEVKENYIAKDKIRELFKELYMVKETKFAKIKTTDNDKLYKFAKDIQKLLEEE